MNKAHPTLRVEGGPYTPPPSVQYGVRAVRAAQLAVGTAYFFGDQLFGSLRRPVPASVRKLQENALFAVGGIFGLNTVAETMSAINCFEVTYNGHKLFSKLKNGRFPHPDEVVEKLDRIIEYEQSQLQDADETEVIA